MSLEIVRLTLGPVATNSYLIGDTTSGEAILIDPVDDAETLHQSAKERGWQIRLILATHAHFDHVLASKALKSLTGAPFWTHRNSVQWLEILPRQGQLFGMGEFPEAAVPDRLLGDTPETIRIGAITLETRFTPGHAPDHLCYYMPQHGILFAGDTVFRRSIGRTDLPGADPATLMRSIQTQIMTLPDETQLLAGHMDPTTVGEERRLNPFLI